MAREAVAVQTRSRAVALIIVLPAGAALVVGVLAGLARLGMELPGASRFIGLHHGGLMVGGFVATVIAVERALSSEHRAALLVPALSAAAAVGLVVDGVSHVAPWLLTMSALGLVLLFASFLRRQLATPLLVMGAGALLWLGGNLAWLDGWAAPRVLPWWIAFLALTITGERLELTRFQRPARERLAVLVAGLALLVTGAAASLVDASVASRLLGAGMVATGAWLIAWDTARRTLRRGDVATYAGIALLAAYAWLAIAGLVLLVDGLRPAGWAYDAAVHAFFLGFVIGAIFAHAPIIFPAVTGIELRFTRLFYLGLVVLHGSLALRVLSAWLEDLTVRRAGASLNGIALILLAIAMVVGVIEARYAHRAAMTTTSRTTR